MIARREIIEGAVIIRSARAAVTHRDDLPAPCGRMHGSITVTSRFVGRPAPGLIPLLSVSYF